MWDKAIETCHSVLTIEPEFQLAKNNLEWALTQKELTIKK
jgi:hypothetical protein